MNRAMNDIVSSYISNLMPTSVGVSSRYKLRASNNIAMQIARISTFKRSCIPPAIYLRTNLDLDIRQLPSISSNCSELTFQISHDQVPQHYMNSKRKLSIVHAKICNRCTNLHLDLYTNYVKDDPICDCFDGAKSAEHYIIECHRFTAQRIFLFNKARRFRPLNVETILCGRDQLSYENSCSIFLVV